MDISGVRIRIAGRVDPFFYVEVREPQGWLGVGLYDNRAEAEAHVKRIKERRAIRMAQAEADRFYDGGSSP